MLFFALAHRHFAGCCPVSLRFSTMLEIQTALPLAQLPRPLDPEGKTLFNSVYGVSVWKKVKRYEIVAAIDGEAVNLYDVNISSCSFCEFVGR